MEEQIYVVKDIKDFNIKDIFECGQCFRWNEQEDGTYTGIINNAVINVKQNANEIIFSGVCKDKKLKEIVDYYFDINRDYSKIKNELSKLDVYLEKSIEFGSGIRILNQELWETIISFIISANNNIPRIKKIIEKLSKNYGEEIVWNGKSYYTFPTAKQLENVSVEDYRKLGLGFRDIRLYETTKMILNKEIDLDKIKKEDTDMVRDELMKLSGVGPKVADCILLFSTLKRFEVFPIDVWVRRVMNQLYIKNEDENKVSKKQIMEIANKKFGNMAGLAQQYLFYWKREDAV